MTSKQELLNTEQAEESLREEPSTQGHTEENRETFGKKAIEDLASQLNKAANTIRDFTQNVRSTSTLAFVKQIDTVVANFLLQECDEEILRRLNDDQLFKLLEEAYHSKKLDEKNKTSIFRVRKSSNTWQIGTFEKMLRT